LRLHWACARTAGAVSRYWHPGPPTTEDRF